jgi:hypothetical protein
MQVLLCAVPLRLRTVLSAQLALLLVVVLSAQLLLLLLLLCVQAAAAGVGQVRILLPGRVRWCQPVHPISLRQWLLLRLLMLVALVMAVRGLLLPRRRPALHLELRLRRRRVLPPLRQWLWLWRRRCRRQCCRRQQGRQHRRGCVLRWLQLPLLHAPQWLLLLLLR